MRRWKLFSHRSSGLAVAIIGALVASVFITALGLTSSSVIARDALNDEPVATRGYDTPASTTTPPANARISAVGGYDGVRNPSRPRARPVGRFLVGEIAWFEVPE